MAQRGNPHLGERFALKGIIGLACVIGGLGAASAPHKVSFELRQKSPGQEVDVIVQFKAAAPAGVRERARMRAIWHRHTLDLVNSSALRVRAGELASLAADPEVEFIHEDHVIRPATFSGTPDYGWLTALTAPSIAASLPYDGTGVGVAILDSGIDDDDDLKDAKGHNRIVYKESFVTGDKGTGDAYGHGNHVAGIVAGNGKHSTGSDYDYKVRGIAPNANLINLRVLDRYGEGRDSDVIAAINRAISLKSVYNIRVINLSLGRPISVGCAADPICQAVEYAWKAGIVVVVAAGNSGRDGTSGNDGYGTITVPGNSPSAITVGAMNTMGTLSRTDDKVTSYSSKGPTAIDHYAKPDLVAPGNRILSLRDSGSTLDQSHPENRVPRYVYSIRSDTNTPDYYQLSGTSMAAPMVSGAAALLLQQNPALTPDQVKARLMLTASKFAQTISTAVDPATGTIYVSHYDVFTIGAGYLDVQAALANRELSDLPARSPVAVYDPVTGTVYLADDPVILWDNRSKWGLSDVWGTTAVSASRSVWKLTSISGEETSSSSYMTGAAILGASSVWGTPSAMGFGSLWSTSARPGAGQTGVGDLSICLDGEN